MTASITEVEQDSKDVGTGTTLIYLSGPMTGIAKFNYPAFNKKAKELRTTYQVINPAEMLKNPNDPWHVHLRRDIAALVKCDAIYMLPGWKESKGARLEHHIASELGMKVMLDENNKLG